MKQTLLFFFVLFLITGFSAPAFSQCPDDNVLVAGNLTPPGVTLSTTQTFATGQYVLATVQAGANYTVQTCGGATFDSQLTIIDNTTLVPLAYNDDWCGLQSYLTFTASSCGIVRVLLDQYYCSNTGVTANVTMTQNTPGVSTLSLTSAPDVNACNGDTVTIGVANNGSGGTGPYTYLWTPATNLAATNVSQTTATVTATQSYTMVITDAMGCFALDTVQVTMLPAPTVNLGSDTTICGGPILLDAGNPGGAYLWNTGAGTQTLNVTTSGNYSVAVQDPSGCINTDNIVITINPLPTVSLGADTSTCGSSLTLDAGSGFSGYSWSTGGSAQTENILASGTVDVTVTDANGCSATDTVIVTLSPAPAVNLGADTTQCGGTITLDAGNPGSLFFWSNSTSSQTTSVTSSGTYSVLVLSAAGCQGADTINVTINYQPMVDLGPDTSICNSTITLDAGNPGSTYLWSNSSTFQTVSAGTGTWSVRVTDPSGCFDQDTVVVTTNSAPTISAGQDTMICQGGTAVLTASGGVSYLWSNGATTTSTAVNPTVSTTYYVTGTDANGCSASDVVNVTMMSASNAQFTASVIGATACFTNQSTNAVTYSWNFGDASAANNTASPCHTYTVNGTYTVTLTVTGPCGTDTYTQIVTITQVGLQDVDLANSMSLFPNPNDGNFTLAFELTSAKDVSVEVMDMTGRLVYNEEQNNITSYHNNISLAAADNGMYMVRIITTEGVVTQRIVVQK